MFAGFWHKVPLVRITVPVIIGIGINMFYPLPTFVAFIVFGFLLSINILLHFIKANRHKTHLKGIALNLLCLGFGFALNTFHNQLIFKSHFSYHQANYFVVQLDEQPLKRAKSFKAKAKVLSCIDSLNSQTTVSGLMILYFEKDSLLFTQLNYGDLILIKNNSHEISAPQNPNEFNYKRYLAFNQIYNQSYLRNKDFVQLNKNEENIFRAFAYSSQKYFNKILHQYVQTKNEIAVAQALLFGYDDDIDADVVKAYSNTGTLHVLAVSGMHVGLVFWLINLLLKYFDKRKYQRIIKVIISLSVIWVYSLICGLSPSILRASVMFSFVAVASAIKSSSNIYNTLAASALVLLLFDSNTLANVGFQLSFCAVIGIVALQKYFNEWFYFKKGFMEELWKIVSVSIAAQLATFPIGMLYFHQFPVYFPISNLVIIPITTLIIFIGIALILSASLASIFSWIPAILGLIMNKLIWLTNNIVILLNDLPGSYINGIHISIVESILLYILIAYFIVYFATRKQRFFRNGLIACCLFFSIQIFESIKIHNQKFITIYNIKNHVALQLVNGENSTIIADKLLLENEYKYRFHLQQHIWASGITKTNSIDLNKAMDLRFNDKIISITNHVIGNEKNILLYGNTFIDINKLTENKQLNKIILASDISKTRKDFIKQKLSKIKSKIIDVGENGAITLSLNDF